MYLYLFIYLEKEKWNLHLSLSCGKIYLIYFYFSLSIMYLVQNIIFYTNMLGMHYLIGKVNYLWYFLNFSL